MTRKFPYPQEEIDKMVDCLVDNELLDSNCNDDVTWLIFGLIEHLTGVSP